MWVQLTFSKRLLIWVPAQITFIQISRRQYPTDQGMLEMISWDRRFQIWNSNVIAELRKRKQGSMIAGFDTAENELQERYTLFHYLDSFFTTHISMIQHLDILVCTMVFWRRIFRILVSFGLLQGFRCLYACTQNAILLQKRSFWNSWLHRAHMFEAGEQVPSSTSWFLRRFLFLFRLRVSRGVSFCYALCVLTSVFLFFSLLSPSWVFA